MAPAELAVAAAPTELAVAAAPAKLAGMAAKARFELVEAYPDLAGVAQASARRNWAELATAFRALDPPGQALATTIIARGPDTKKFLEKVREHRPDDPLALALLGRVTIGTGALAGSPLLTRTVAQAEIAASGPAGTAEKLFDAALRHEPDLLVARHGRVITARALGLDPAQARRRYDDAAALAPAELYLQLAFLTSLSPTWGGSAEAMLDFARAAAAAAPPGSTNGALVAVAHLDRTADTDEDHLRRPAVVAELVSTAERSIWSSSFEHGHGWVDAVSYFAMAFTFAQRLAEAARCFDLLGDLGAEAGWDLLRGDPRKSFASYRKEVLARARR